MGELESESKYLVEPVDPPPLNLPRGPSTVTVRVIDTSATVHVDPGRFMTPKVHGHDDLACPAYSLLITHFHQDKNHHFDREPKPRHILFDLGVRLDWRSSPPSLVENIDRLGLVQVNTHVAAILEEAGQGSGQGKVEEPADRKFDNKPSRGDIEAVIWSHGHFDHTGDISTFPSSTKLLVGPGFRDAYSPGHPKDEKGVMFSKDLERAEEINFDALSSGQGEGVLEIGGFKAFDYFGDGSFYLLDMPGHAPGHLGGLARIATPSDGTGDGKYIFMVGDACHHGGEFRPSPYLPLPKTIEPSPFPHSTHTHCPGELLLSLQRNQRADQSFYDISFGLDVDQANKSRDQLQVFDANDNVLVIMAHDATLKEAGLPFFPREVKWDNAVKERSRWAFVNDFKDAL